MYQVKIQSADPIFIFQYSKDNVYGNTCLYQAFKCKKEGENITVSTIWHYLGDDNHHHRLFFNISLCPRYLSQSFDKKIKP
jgi:hypothetical protein